MNGRPVIGAVLITLLALGQPVLAVTEISGDLEGDVTWTADNGPYLITGNANIGAVEPGATLTIEAGTTVEFASSANLNVFGDLIANGTADQPITLTGSGNWRINIFDSTNTTLAHIKASHSNDGIFIYDGNAEISNVEFENGGAGFGIFNSTANIANISLETGDLMLFDNIASTIVNAVLQGGRLFIDKGVAVVNHLFSNGGNAFLSDTDITFSNIDIRNVSFGAGMHISASTANIAGLTLTNTGLGLDVYNGSSLTLHDANISNMQSGPGLIISDSFADIVRADIANGPSLGVSIGGNSEVYMNDVAVSGFQNAPGISMNGVSFIGTGLNLSDNSFGFVNSGNSTITRSRILDNSQIGIQNSGEYLKVSQSLISGHSVFGVYGDNIDARGNYWGHPAGPTVDPFNPETIPAGDAILGNILYEPWLSSFCESNCHSNIMFLPGIMSSRLYEGSEQLWEPNVFTRDSEFEALYLDGSGASIHDIYTKDVLDNSHAYGKLIADLNSLKATGTINDYEAVPYDWRLSMGDILNTGIKREDDTVIYGSVSAAPYIESMLHRLAANSKSGKVTIVAHSNGGLVTKALINKLGEEAGGLIDRIIFVAVPQLGTPQAIGALLHGYNAGQPVIYPFVLSPERARDLAINMPMIYQLMPFADYYNSEGAMVGTPYVTFEDGSATQQFIDHYGYAITPGELFDFLTGAEGRVTATYDDLENPIIANPTLLAEAQALQQTINSSWEIPVGIEFHQIAGIGEDTLAGITYKTIQKCAERTIVFTCRRYEDALSYKPNTVIDGDGTVVVPSALAINNTERWWFDLDDYNPIFFPYKHSDILEIDELRKFIFENLIVGTTNTVPEYVSTNKPPIERSNRLVFTLHSPLALSAIDEHGNMASEQEVTIPSATYNRYGEVQVITLPAGTKFTLVLTGEAEGSFTLEMEEFQNDDLVAQATFSAIPSGPQTIATVAFNEGTLEQVGRLQIDYNGDSVVDLTYTPILGETVILPDEIIAPAQTITSGGSGGYRLPGQVLGASDTDLTIEQLTQIIYQLQIVIVALTALKDQIPDEQYNAISNQVLVMLNTLEPLLSAQKR